MKILLRRKTDFMARYYLWTWETALIEECGYKGGLPYHDWVSPVTHNRSTATDQHQHHRPFIPPETTSNGPTHRSLTRSTASEVTASKEPSPTRNLAKTGHPQLTIVLWRDPSQTTQSLLARDIILARLRVASVATLLSCPPTIPSLGRRWSKLS